VPEALPSTAEGEGASHSVAFENVAAQKAAAFAVPLNANFSEKKIIEITFN
jgi:hypothetical protein